MALWLFPNVTLLVTAPWLPPKIPSQLKQSIHRRSFGNPLLSLNGTVQGGFKAPVKQNPGLLRSVWRLRKCIVQHQGWRMMSAFKKDATLKTPQQILRKFAVRWHRKQRKDLTLPLRAFSFFCWWNVRFYGGRQSLLQHQLKTAVDAQHVECCQSCFWLVVAACVRT